MRIGIIGLGNIGGPIAANLLADNYHVTVLDSDLERVNRLVTLGASSALNPAEVALQTDITILSLPTPEIIIEVAENWLSTAAPNSVLIDISTNSPETIRTLGKKIAERGSYLLEAPLTGGVPGAQARKLVFMVGGDRQAYERCKPVLEKLSRAVFYLGELGLGNTAKLINSLMAFSATWMSLEGLAMATKAGIDLRTIVELVRTAGASNFYMDGMVEYINYKEKPVMFALELAAKDARLIASMGQQLGVPTPVAESIAEVFRAAEKNGLAKRDWSDLVQFMESSAGVQFNLGESSCP